ncbi:MAG: HEAT repeat domain-containing protein [Calditrichaeota bacterium]|nr:HEAT repeat domain-containing protein [Calditrichota bacterium]
MKLFRLFVILWILVLCLHSMHVSAATIYTDLAQKEILLGDKLTQTFRFSICHKKYPYIWIIYRIDKGISPPSKIIPPFEGASKFPRLGDILMNEDERQLVNSDNRQIGVPFNKECLGKTQIDQWCADDCLIVIKFFLQSGRPRFLEIEPMSPHAEFDDQDIPIFWLGTVSASRSFSYLKNIFRTETHCQWQRQLVNALSYHNLPEEFFPFARNILKNKFSDEVKMAAISGLGNYPDRRCVRLLALISAKTVSEKLRSAAIQSLAQNQYPGARRILRKLALKNQSADVRKRAIFWLGQIGDKNSIRTLVSIVTNGKNRAIKEHAIFAISQLPNDVGKAILRKIAVENPDADLRETAIYWIGQTEEEKRLEFMIDIFHSMQN